MEKFSQLGCKSLILLFSYVHSEIKVGWVSWILRSCNASIGLCLWLSPSYLFSLFIWTGLCVEMLFCCLGLSVKS